MSHFTVLVVGDNVEEQLAPFQENNMGDCPTEYMEFNETEGDYREEWNRNETLIDDWHCDSFQGETIARHAKLLKKVIGGKPFSFTCTGFNRIEVTHRIRVYATNDNTVENVYLEVLEVVSKETASKSRRIESRDIKVKVRRIEPPTSQTIKQKYETFERFVEEYHQGRKDETNGKYGYWHNPNAKWDWYQIGGRWTGFFKVKGVVCDGHHLPTAEHKLGNPGVFDNKPRPGYADQIRKGDVDFEGIKADAAKEANETYDTFEKAIKGAEMPTKSWDEFRKDFKNIEEARQTWHETPFMKALSAGRKKYDLPLIMGCPVEYYCVLTGGRDAFVKVATDNCFSTFAVLMDGRWYEKGSMGWWATVTNENDNWGEEFMKLLESVSNDTLLTVVDCHI